MNPVETSDDMAILIIGFDGYSDLWDDYFYLLNKYWSDRSFSVYLANNIKTPKFENVNVINCGEDAEWSKKVQIALEQINAKYICLLLEDFFTGSKVCNEIISETLGLIKNEEINYYKINNFSKVKTPRYKSIEYLYTIPENLEYGVSLQPAIWNRDYLLEKLGTDNYNAWIFEYDRIKESEGKSNEPLNGCVFDDRNILQIQHGVVQGKFLPPAVKYFEKQDYHFNTSVRRVMTKSEFVTYKIKLQGKHLVPKKNRKSVKKLLNKFGYKFVSDLNKK